MERKEIIDLHCHILPGLDDGISELEESLEACRIAVRDGITGIVATPHFKEGFFETTPDVIYGSISILKEKISSEGIDLKIYPGSEVHLTDNIAGKVKNGSILSLNDTKKYILLELPYQQYPVDFERYIFSLKLAGITPILAHPERVKYFKDDSARVGVAVRMGALTQVTSSSIMGIFGEEVIQICFELATKGLIHIIASDSHDASYRPPQVMDAYREMSKIVGERKAFKMISDNPLAVICGEELPEAPTQEDDEDTGGERSSFFRFFSRRQ